MKKSVHGRNNYAYPGLFDAVFFCLAFWFLLMMFGIGRFVLASEVVAAQLEIRAFFVDLAVAVFIALLTQLLALIHPAVSTLFLIFISAFYIANMEMVAALDTFINFSDLRYVIDARFIRGSLSILTFPWYTFFLLLSVILYLVALARVKRNEPVKLKYLILGIFISVSVVHVLSPRDGEWNSSNLLWLSVTRSVPRPTPPTVYGTGSRIHADVISPPRPGVQNGDEPYFHRPPHAERNVLMVVLEGIPGVYVRQVREWTGVKYPVEMPNLSRIAERSLVVPNFFTHNRQTMRGLYSLLSGDYSKLSLSTPKIYEYVQIPRELRNPCLPEILANAGYTTVYLQAADLAFMSKDIFMPEAGFQQVLGREYFLYQHVPFGWGPDDRAFFEQAADFIDDLNEKSRPWFLTLLNVGTHHPYAVPEEFAGRFSSRKEAAVAYLDEALGAFFERLDEGGFLDDTLVIFTSDESHGVTGQPYGNYWGLAIAYSPDSSGIINPGVFGLIDVPYSVLDYLGLNEQPHSFPERSIFREQQAECPILFGPYFSERKGVVKKRMGGSRVQVIQSSNGELFSGEYRTKIVNADEGRKMADMLRDYQLAADSSLYHYERKDRRYILLENDEFIVGRRESRLLSSGQYLDFPGGTTVTVELEACVELPGGYGKRESSALIRLVLQMLEWYGKMSIPEISIPILRDRDSLYLSFSFYTDEPLSRVWAYLKAVSVHHSSTAKLTIKRFSVESKESESRHDFRINRFSIENEERPVSSELPGLTLRPALPPVAHAGGGYKGMIYTNSVEALEENAGAFVLFEIDFEWTKDKQLVGLHDWGDSFRRIFGFDAGEPLDYPTFRELKTLGGFTPVDLPLIEKFLSNNPPARIITDVKSDNSDALRMIARFFTDSARRFIPQVYHPDEFVKALEIGYRNIIWTLYRYPHVYDPHKVLSQINYWKDEYHITPFAVTMPVPAVERGVAKVLAEAGIPVYAHTVNSCDDHLRLLTLGVSSVYTDSVNIMTCYSSK